MILVVVGMHKSGTTLVAQALHEAGIAMLPADQPLETGVSPLNGVPREKYEWRAFKQLNYALLNAQPHDSLGVDLDAPLAVTPERSDTARALIDDASTWFADWGFKDPRTTLTYPFWRSLLPQHRLICMRRDPGEIIDHYVMTKDIKTSRDRTNALRHCDVYNQRLDRMPGSKLMLDYQALMTSRHEWARLEDFVGWRLPDVRRQELYHCRR